LALSVYVEEWTVGVVLFMDSFHAVCEKFYFEALAVLFWICCCFNFWEHCVNVEIISYHRNILTEAGCLAYKPTWKWMNNMLQCCYLKWKLVVIAVGCAVYKIQGLPWLWLISLHIFSDTDCPGEMFWRNYQHRLCCVPNPWPAMV